MNKSFLFNEAISFAVRDFLKVISLLVLVLINIIL